ncbi:ABC transporter substrate-binding protein [Roseomonas aerophila]|uniref:ABC transporter substrate-binding protein n=1 Tax=Teichococcus aerophilus TaxID=1224513 RepID=A0ABR7RN80_9PROT|nr:ABC transporter substrate-binding protein [Pseudoroseomonas aerophila]MBC9208019.1 ABC transporter substrate-binding protein [Pseudoroseomonas aerophila]
MLRRSLLQAAAAAPLAGLAAPRSARAASATTLRFVPVIDLAFVDPIYSTAQVSRNHGFMVFDTLYGMNSKLEATPQMVEGHRVEDDGRRWDLTLREGLTWHDGEKVTARDCVASIRRWSKRDPFGDALMAATDELSAPNDRTIRFRLKRPFPLLPQALGKAAVPACFMMPERLANTDPFKVMPEVIGSGPFRFVANERVPGARNVYQRFEGYKPRENGVSDWTSGPKVVHYDRVEWTTMPDAATGAAALQSGEQDWQETTPHDLLPLLRRNRNISVDVLDPLGFTCLMRVNHLQPPFNNPAIRRALLGAIDQRDFMTAVAGDDAEFQHTPIGFFCPNTPMASDVGLDIFRGPRDFAKVKRDLAAAGYNGEKVVVLIPADSLAQKPLGDVAFGTLQQAGMNVEYVGIDFGSVLTRRNRKTPVEDGGWSAFVANWQGMDWLNPAAHLTLRGNASYPGWSESPRTEALRQTWLEATTVQEQQAICAEIQRLSFEEVPYYPLGQYKQPTAYRKAITGIGRGTATFWNVRPA